MQPQRKLVTLIPGDGVGPECVRAAQRIIEATGAAVAWEERQAGASVFRQGIASGVPQETIARAADHRLRVAAGAVEEAGSRIDCRIELGSGRGARSRAMLLVGTSVTAMTREARVCKTRASATSASDPQIRQAALAVCVARRRSLTIACVTRRSYADLNDRRHRFEWIEPDESNGARLRSEATAQRDPVKLQKA